MSAKAPAKETGECPKTKLTGKMFYYKKKYIHEKSTRRMET